VRRASKVARIGALYIGLADAESFKKELREGFRELGYEEGQNITFEFRSAEGKLERLPELASELVRLKVDVIVANNRAGNLPARERSVKANSPGLYPPRSAPAKRDPFGAVIL